MSGRGTAEGVVFQAEFGAAAAALLLAERAISRLGTGLPGRPLRILFETPTAVDDVLVETDVGIIYVQAKRTISLSPKTDSELASVADLRLGHEWRKQFRGTPPSPGHSDPTLAAVRHIHIGLLDETEKADLAAKSPSLAAAIEAGGPKMEELARNPFNLALLADLLCDGVAAASLSKVSSRGDLLERYWAARVGGLGVAGTTSLKAVVDEMIGKRSIDLADTKVPIAAAPMVDELQRVGVLTKTSNIRIGFRHHVLFD